MSTPSATTRARPRRAPPRRRALLRRVGWLLAVVVVAGVAVAAIVAPGVDKAVKEIALPLRHEDIIRQQAADKGLDPALIAGIIYTESRFRDQTSHAGAKGLMQLLPSTADDIARKSGGTAFVQGDLADPQVNISYGSFYLRYLIRRYGGNEVLAIAAYNAGEGKVDEWVFRARRRGEQFDHTRHIPFPETRHYVEQVLDMRARYREQYPRELGL
jgi:soluble lytic murein transglycosylase